MYIYVPQKLIQLDTLPQITSVCKVIFQVIAKIMIGNTIKHVTTNLGMGGYLYNEDFTFIC